MYESIEQARVVYLAKLREFKEWQSRRVGPAVSWTEQTFKESERWAGCLTGIADALGLTEEEDRELRQEAGLE